MNGGHLWIFVIRNKRPNISNWIFYFRITLRNNLLLTSNEEIIVSVTLHLWINLEIFWGIFFSFVKKSISVFLLTWRWKIHFFLNNQNNHRSFDWKSPIYLLSFFISFFFFFLHYNRDENLVWFYSILRFLCHINEKYFIKRRYWKSLDTYIIVETNWFVKRIKSAYVN